MENDIRIMLEEEIETNFKKLSDLTPGTKEYIDVANNLERLYKLHIEETENERSFRDKCDKNIISENELILKEKQLEEQATDRKWKTGTQIGLGAANLLLTAFWVIKGFKFEETGSFTSTTFRNVFGFLKPSKR